MHRVSRCLGLVCGYPVRPDEGKKGVTFIDPAICTGVMSVDTLCKFDAIRRRKE